MKKEAQSHDRSAGDGTQSLTRAISVLQAVASHSPRGARLADVLADTRLSKATAHRLAAALVRDELLDFDAGHRIYHLGRRLAMLGALASARHPRTFANGSGGFYGAELTGAPRLDYQGRAISLAHLLCDRHALTGSSRPAMIHEAVSGQTTELRYGKLSELSARFAAVLTAAGVTKGNRVAVLLPKGAELIIAALAIWRIGGIYMPLFTTYSPESIGSRIASSEASVLITTYALAAKVERAVHDPLPLILVEGEDAGRPNGRAVQFWSSLHATEPLNESVEYDENDPFVMSFAPKPAEASLGVLTPVRALAEIEQFMRVGLDVRDDDVYWNMADQGWAYGIYYGLIGPLLLGRSTLFCEGPYDVQQGYRVLSKFRVTNLTAAPSQIKAWHRADLKKAPFQLSLRLLSVGGEPLPPEVVRWATQKLEIPLLNQFGQRETGMIIRMQYDTNDTSSPKPRSVGYVMPGFQMVILDQDGNELPRGSIGQLAIDVKRSPLFWFESYVDDAESTRKRFRYGDGFYVLEDTGLCDEEGRIHYWGRPSEALSMQIG